MVGFRSGRAVYSRLCHCMARVELDHVLTPQFPHLQYNKADEELGNPLTETRTESLEGC